MESLLIIWLLRGERHGKHGLGKVSGHWGLLEDACLSVRWLGKWPADGSSGGAKFHVTMQRWCVTLQYNENLGPIGVSRDVGVGSVGQLERVDGVAGLPSSSIGVRFPCGDFVVCVLRAWVEKDKLRGR